MRGLVFVFLLPTVLPALEDLKPVGQETSSPEDADWSLVRVRIQVDQSRQHLRSIVVEATSHGSAFSQPRVTHQIFAIDGRNRFLDRAHLNDRHGNTDGANDPEWRRSYLTEDMLTTVWVVDRFAKMSREQSSNAVGDTLRYDYFMECTGWWPPGESSLPEDEPVWALHKALQNEDCRVQDSLETVGEHRCVVIEIPGRDKLWLDVDRGCAVIRRERQWEGKWTIYENSDFREFGDCIWLPWKLHRVIHHGVGPILTKEEQASLLVQSTQTVERMEVNHVPDEMFVFKPEPGMLIYDVERNKRWAIPGGQEEILSDVSQAATAFVGVANDKRKRSNGAYVAMEAILLVIAATAWVLLFRRRCDRRLIAAIKLQN